MSSNVKASLVKTSKKEEMELLFDLLDSDTEDLESTIPSLARVEEKGKSKVEAGAGAGNMGKGKKVISRVAALMTNIYQNDVIWSIFRTFGTLEEQVAKKGAGGVLSLVRCMRGESEGREKDMGNKPVGKTIKALKFFEFLPYLVCWILDRGRPETRGWLGFQEDRTKQGLINRAEEFLEKEVKRMKDGKEGILENWSIFSLSIGHFMMASWEEVEKYGGYRGVKVPRMSHEGKSVEIKDMIFVKGAREMYEKLNTFKSSAPMEYLQGIGSAWFNRDLDSPRELNRWLPEDEWLGIFKRWFAKDFKNNFTFPWEKEDMVLKTMEFCKILGLGECC